MLFVSQPENESNRFFTASVGPVLGDFDVSRVWGLNDAVERLRCEPADAVLLHMAVPDQEGLSALIRIRSHAPDVPVVVLTERDDEAGALWLVRQGAQDCVALPEVGGSTLGRVIRHAIERNVIRVKLRALSLRDELTGIYNRRGFFEQAQLCLAVSGTSGRSFVIFADLDGLKEINDRWGHDQGDLALAEFAGILQNSFQVPDVVARVGGDEFVALARESSPGRIQRLVQAVRTEIETRNQTRRGGPRLSASLGMAAWSANAGRSLEEVVAEADAAMYTHRQARNGSPFGSWTSALLNPRRRRAPGKAAR